MGLYFADESGAGRGVPISVGLGGLPRATRSARAIREASSGAGYCDFVLRSVDCAELRAIPPIHSAAVELSV